MEWNSEEKENKNKGMSSSTKILLGIIICLILIMILFLILIINQEEKKVETQIKDIAYLSVDGKKVENIKKEKFFKTIDKEKYICIEEFAKVVGYEYHKGEYKSSSIEEDKCYVEGKQETTSFYLDDNTIYKLPINKLSEEYNEITLEKKVILEGDAMYAPFETISKAFNVSLKETNGILNVYTLDFLVSSYDKKVQEWGYTSIAEQSFENRKALLYGYLVVKKAGGYYKIINLDNTKEFILDRYSSIEFLEHMNEFFVSNPSKQMGIVNIVDEKGKIKIEPGYEDIRVLDQKEKLYLIKKAAKYGVINDSGFAIIYPEYDNIGLNNKYLIFDTLIPVCREQKWGAYDKDGKLILNIEYDEFGYNLTNIEINGIKQSVHPVLTIEKCKSIVVKKDEKYGLFNISGEEFVPIVVDGIYAINGVEDENLKYFMLYNGRELNVIEILIKAGKIKEKEEDDDNLVIDVTNSIQNNTVKENNLIVQPNSIYNMSNIVN